MPDAPTAPESMGNSISGGGAPQASAGMPTAQPGAQPVTTPTPLSVPPPAQYMPTTFKSVGDTINQYKQGVLTATAQGGMAGQKAFLQAHQAAVDAKTNALQNASAQAQAVGGNPGLGAALNGVINGGTANLRMSSMAASQADFQEAAKERGASFGNYMKEVNAAIPLAQAAAQSRMQDMVAKQKQASVGNQVNALISSANDIINNTTAQNTQNSKTNADKIAPIQAQLDGVNQQVADATQMFTSLRNQVTGRHMDPNTGEISAKAPDIFRLLHLVGEPLPGNGPGDKLLYSQYQTAQQKLAGLLTQRDNLTGQINSLNTPGTPIPTMSDLLPQLAQKLGNPDVTGEVLKMIASPNSAVTNIAAPEDVAHLKTIVKGLTTDEATNIASSQDYQNARAVFNKGLTAKVDSQGRVPGTDMSPFEAASSAINNSNLPQNVKSALIAEFAPSYRSSGRDKVETAKQAQAGQ